MTCERSIRTNRSGGAIGARQGLEAYGRKARGPSSHIGSGACRAGSAGGGGDAPPAAGRLSNTPSVWTGGGRAALGGARGAGGLRFESAPAGCGFSDGFSSLPGPIAGRGGVRAPLTEGRRAGSSSLCLAAVCRPSSSLWGGGPFEPTAAGLALSCGSAAFFGGLVFHQPLSPAFRFRSANLAARGGARNGKGIRILPCAERERATWV